MRTIAVINQKGGCGKTTTAVNLSAAFVRRKFRTLLIDLDPQSHCAAALGVPEKQIDKDVADALLAPADAPLDDSRYVWRIARHLDLLPSRTRLAGLESSRGGLADRPDRERCLAGVIQRLGGSDPDGPTTGANDKYDVALIDCPPSIGLLTFNALVAATEVLIPVETSFFSLRGASKQLKTIRSISRRLGVRPRARLLATLHDASVPLANDLLGELRERFGSAVIPGRIRLDPTLRSAASFGRPAIEFAPESDGVQDYESLCEWLIEHASIDRESLEQDEREIDALDADDLGRRLLPIESDRTDPEPKREPASPESETTGAPRSAPPVDAGMPSRVEEIRALIAGRPGSRLEELAQRARDLHGRDPTTPAPAGAVLSPSNSSSHQTLANPHAAAPAVSRPVAIELVPDRSPIDQPVLSSVRRLFGVRQTSRGALFIQPSSIGRRVNIAGSFNGWNPAACPMRRNDALGVFELQIELPPGTHEYRLVIDGAWRPDQYNQKAAVNTFGGANNVIELPPRGRTP